MKTLLNTLAATIAFTLFPIAVVLAVDSTKSRSPAKVAADNPNKPAAAAK